MPVSQSLSPVLFHGDTIFVVDHQGEPFAPVRPIIENLGLGWGSQHLKLCRNKTRWSVEYITVSSNGGPQKTLCIPVKKLAGFLSAINTLKVGEELHPKIVQYREKCDEALWNYWATGSAKHSESPVSQPRQPDLPGDDQKPKQLTESERDLLNTIKDLDTSNRRLAKTLKMNEATYVDLLERYSDLLQAHLETKIKAISADYESKLQFIRNQLQYSLKGRVNHD